MKGVLGALVHVTKHEAQRGNEDIKKANKPAADDDNLSVEEVESINDQKFMIGRESTPSELEETYKLGPFEIFPLFLGKVRKDIHYREGLPQWIRAIRM